jgi:hypothetical protein
MVNGGGDLLGGVWSFGFSGPGVLAVGAACRCFKPNPRPAAAGGTYSTSTTSEDSCAICLGRLEDGELYVQRDARLPPRVPQGLHRRLVEGLQQDVPTLQSATAMASRCSYQHMGDLLLSCTYLLQSQQHYSSRHDAFVDTYDEL